MATFRPAGDLKSKKASGVGSASKLETYVKRKYSMDEQNRRHPRRTEEIAGDLSQLVKITEHNMQAKYRFLPATVGFTQEESERLSDEDIRQIGIEFAAHLASPLGLARVPFSVQKHTSKETGRIDLHVTLARYDLQTGKTFQPYVDYREPRSTRTQYGDLTRLQTFQAIQTIRYQLDDPNDPLRTRWIKDMSSQPKKRKVLLAKINAHVEAYVKCGSVKCRDDVLTLLHTMGFDTPRAGKDYITIQQDGMGKGIRLKGAAYSHSFAGFIEPSGEPQRKDSERRAELYQQLDDIDAHRLPLFEKHFRAADTGFASKQANMGVDDTALVLNKSAGKTDYELPSRDYFNASEPSSVSAIGRRPKIITASKRNTQETLNKKERNRILVPGHINHPNNLRLIDLCVFNAQQQLWAYRLFPYIYVSDLGSRITHYGTESEWKLAAALATAKGWESIALHCSSIQSAMLAIKHHQSFGIEIVAITIGDSGGGGGPMSTEEIDQLKEQVNETRNRDSQSESLCHDGDTNDRDEQGDGGDAERAEQVEKLCGQLDGSSRELHDRQQEFVSANAVLSKAIAAVDTVRAARGGELSGIEIENGDIATTGTISIL